MGIEIVPNPPQPVCDFCGRPANAMHGFPCDDFELPDYGYRSRGEWHACIDCAGLIARDDWKSLKECAVSLFHASKPGLDRELSDRFVSDLHEAFRSHRK